MSFYFSFAGRQAPFTCQRWGLPYGLSNARPRGWVKCRCSATPSGRASPLWRCFAVAGHQM